MHFPIDINISDEPINSKEVILFQDQMEIYLIAIHLLIFHLNKFVFYLDYQKSVFNQSFRLRSRSQ